MLYNFGQDVPPGGGAVDVCRQGQTEWGTAAWGGDMLVTGPWWVTKSLTGRLNPGLRSEEPSSPGGGSSPPLAGEVHRGTPGRQLLLPVLGRHGRMPLRRQMPVRAQQ